MSISDILRANISETKKLLFLVYFFCVWWGFFWLVGVVVVFCFVLVFLIVCLFFNDLHRNLGKGAMMAGRADPCTSKQLENYFIRPGAATASSVKLKNHLRCMHDLLSKSLTERPFQFSDVSVQTKLSGRLL